MHSPRLHYIKKAMIQKGYVIHHQPYHLNIVGIRSLWPIPNVFDDCIIVFYVNDQKQEVFIDYDASTDPCFFWTNNPIKVSGDTVLCEGQYPKTFELEDDYLKQVKPLPCFSHQKRELIQDYNQPISRQAGVKLLLHPDETWTAGSQVFYEPDDYEQFITLCQKAIPYQGSCFDYTLLSEKDIYL